VTGKSSTLPARMRSRHGKTKSLGELQWTQVLSQSDAKSERHKFGSADNVLVSGSTEPSASGDLQRMCLEMSNSASLDRLAVYDQPARARKLSLQVCHCPRSVNPNTLRPNFIIQAAGRRRMK